MGKLNVNWLETFWPSVELEQTLRTIEIFLTKFVTISLLAQSRDVVVLFVPQAT